MLLPLAAMAAPLTAEFQQNDTYQGTVMMRLRNQDTIIAGPSTVSMDVDGGDAALGDALFSMIFLRFDEVFGDAPGQVPYGSHIVRAGLEVVTNTSSNAQSGNIFTVAPLVSPLLVPATGTIYAAYANNAGFGGPDFADGHTGRPGNPFRSVNAPILTQDQGERTSNDITEIVRGWAGGNAESPLNHGLIISDTNGTDGWAIVSIGNTTAANRPKLRIEFYPPAMAVARQAATMVLSQGTGIPGTDLFYDGGVSAWLPDTVTPVNSASFATLSQRVPEDGSTITGARYLDGPNPPTLDSADDQMLIQFNNIFGTQPGQIKILPNLKIERASLRLTTGTTGDNRSSGPVDVHPMLTPWYASDEFGVRTYKRYHEFLALGAPPSSVGQGPSPATGDAGPVEFSYWGMQLNQVVDADVTASVRAWAAGRPNLGWSIQQSTSDGWAIFFQGANTPATRPQLIISYSYDPDADSDGMDDVWEAANGTGVNTPDADGDADSDGLTNLAEFFFGTRANLADTDGDGYNDKAESGTGLWVDAANTGTSPLKADTDGDGLRDGLENPTLPWTGAGQPGSDPNKVDSDGDGFPDFTEMAFLTNPASAVSVPAVPYNVVLSENFDAAGSVNSTTNFLISAGTFAAGIYDTLSGPNANAVQLTDGVATNVNSAVAWDYVPAQGKSVQLRFDYRMTADAGTVEAADGFGIGLFRVSNPAYGPAGAVNPGAAPRQWEDPRSGGGSADAVWFGFDIFGGAVEGNTLRITGPENPGTLLAAAVPAFPLNNGLFNRVTITAHTAGPSGTILHVDVTTDVNGSPVTTRVVSNLRVPGFDISADQFRVVAGGRNGTVRVKTEIDNLQLAVAGTVAPPLPPFDITGILPTAGGLSITWSAVAGVNYTIEGSETLSGTWSTIGSPVRAESSTATAEVPMAGTPSVRFFRVRRPQ